MNINERKSLYRLISQFWPNAKLLKDATMRTAWGKVLVNFPADAVKKRILELAATSKYPPDLAELTAGLAPAALTHKQQILGATAPLPAGAHLAPTQQELEQTRKLQEDLEKMGGVCPVLHKASSEGERGSCGEIFRRHIPQDCPPDCRVLAYWGSCERKDRYTQGKEDEQAP